MSPSDGAANPGKDDPSLYIPETLAGPVVTPNAPPDYEVLGVLGRVGMGVVYKARQTSLDRVVALKMEQGGLYDPTGLERFRQEARAAAALDHPGIVSVYDFGEINGEPYCTMALVEGDSLSGVLKKRGPLPPRQAAELVADIADAVAYAHGRGILHRDLKPDNVLLNVQGRAKIVDLGLGR